MAIAGWRSGVPCSEGLGQPTTVAFRGGRSIDDQDGIRINVVRMVCSPLGWAFDHAVQRPDSPRLIVPQGNALYAVDGGIECHHQAMDLAHGHWRIPPPSFPLELDARKLVDSASQLGWVVLNRPDYACEHQWKIQLRRCRRNIACIVAWRSGGSHRTGQFFPHSAIATAWLTERTLSVRRLRRELSLSKLISTTPSISYHRLKGFRKGELRPTRHASLSAQGGVTRDAPRFTASSDCRKVSGWRIWKCFSSERLARLTPAALAFDSDWALLWSGHLGSKQAGYEIVKRCSSRPCAMTRSHGIRVGSERVPNSTPHNVRVRLRLGSKGRDDDSDCIRAGSNPVRSVVAKAKSADGSPNAVYEYRPC